MVSDSDAERVVKLMTWLRREAEQSDRLVKRADLAADPSDARRPPSTGYLASGITSTGSTERSNVSRLRSATLARSPVEKCCGVPLFDPGVDRLHVGVLWSYRFDEPVVPHEAGPPR